MPSALGLWAYISGKSLVPMLQLSNILSVENNPVMESSQASNSTSNIATNGSIADGMGSGSSSTSLNTSSTTMDTLPEFVNWPEKENQKDKEEHNASK